MISNDQRIERDAFSQPTAMTGQDHQEGSGQHPQKAGNTCQD